MREPSAKQSSSSSWRLYALALCLGIAATVAISAAAGRGSSADPLASAYGTTDLGNGRHLPAVVARVGSTDISAKWFAETVALGRLSNVEHGSGLSETEIERGALDRLIQLAALADRAASEGVTVTDSAVAQEIRIESLERKAALAHNPQANAAFDALLSSLHLSNAAEYDSAQQTINAVRAAMVEQALVIKHVGPYASDLAKAAYVRSVVASERVQIFIQLPVGD